MIELSGHMVESGRLFWFLQQKELLETKKILLLDNPVFEKRLKTSKLLQLDLLRFQYLFIN